MIYARVSSKEQEKEGFSIPAQLKLLKEYAAANGFTVVQEYIDVETAKQTGRAAFGEMVAYLKAHPSVRVMLVEKTDRLYRNLKDWVTVDELDVEMHFPKEGVVLSRELRSSEKFMHGIKVLMAKNYIDNLSEEARKGMQEKAEQGIWPTKTPLPVFGVTNSRFTGVYAEFAVASAGMIAKKNTRLSDIDAASVPVVVVTAWQALFEHAHLTGGQTVLIHGAAGNVGAYAVQLAHRAGLRVIATAGAERRTCRGFRPPLCGCPSRYRFAWLAKALHVHRMADADAMRQSVIRAPGPS